MSHQSNNIPKVFISSTVEDLLPYRSAAKETATGAGFLPVMLKYFPAESENPPLDACLKKVDKCDLLIVIVAYRCGWIPSKQPGDERKSITRLECERALENGKEVLAFVVDSDYEWHESLKEEYSISKAVIKGKAYLLNILW